mmetsp:Transcript_18571/g.30807  ORF Transcript_18571/g.30807 Transcript_18571/m.30807 type:complete len:265 (+) Transcript_18571:1367-2161(+)
MGIAVGLGEGLLELVTGGAILDVGSNTAGVNEGVNAQRALGTVEQSLRFVAFAHLDRTASKTGRVALEDTVGGHGRRGGAQTAEVGGVRRDAGVTVVAPRKLFVGLVAEEAHVGTIVLRVGQVNIGASIEGALHKAHNFFVLLHVRLLGIPGLVDDAALHGAGQSPLPTDVGQHALDTRLLRKLLSRTTTPARPRKQPLARSISGRVGQHGPTELGIQHQVGNPFLLGSRFAGEELLAARPLGHGQVKGIAREEGQQGRRRFDI